MGRRGYPAEFRREVLDLLDAGRSVTSAAHDLDVNDQTIYFWRRQDRIDRRLVLGVSTKGRAGGEEEVLRAGGRVRDRAASGRSAQCADQPKRRYGGQSDRRTEGRRVQVACRVLGVSESGFYEQCRRSRMSPEDRTRSVRPMR